MATSTVHVGLLGNQLHWKNFLDWHWSGQNYIRGVAKNMLGKTIPGMSQEHYKEVIGNNSVENNTWMRNLFITRHTHKHNTVRTSSIKGPIITKVVTFLSSTILQNIVSVHARGWSATTNTSSLK